MKTKEQILLERISSLEDTIFHLVKEMRKLGHCEKCMSYPKDYAEWSLVSDTGQCTKCCEEGEKSEEAQI